MDWEVTENHIYIRSLKSWSDLPSFWCTKRLLSLIVCAANNNDKISINVCTHTIVQIQRQKPWLSNHG